MARCKGCGRHIKLKYYYETGLCHRCYQQQINKNERLENRIVPKKSSVRSYFVKKISRTSIIASIIILIVIFILYSISSNSGIVGKWQAEQESDFTMNFKQDGNIIMEKGGTVISPVGLKYKIIDNKTLSIGVGANTLTSNYEITNGKLILADESGKLQFKKIFSENSFSQIANSAKKILPTQECPQINVPLKEGIAPFIDIGEYGGWKVDSYDSTFNIHCYKGNREGQKPVYWYCGEGTSIEFPMAFIQKTMINSDGSIGKTIKQSFYNIYDENKKFVKTICGEDPDKIAEKEWKEIKDSIRGIWD